MQTITPFLWFNDQAEEAANFYVSVFEAGGPAAPAVERRRSVRSPATATRGRAPRARPWPSSFQIEGQEFTALNGGPAHANFTEAISFLVNCETQDDVDQLWNALTRAARRANAVGSRTATDSHGRSSPPPCTGC